MATQLLSGAGKRMLSPVVLGCLWAFALPADARAQKFDNPECRVHRLTQIGVTTWQLRGTVDVSGLITNTNVQVKVKVQFQKKAKGAADWSDMFDSTIRTKPINGIAKIDTGFQNFTPAPAAGDEYRILLSGTWMKTDPPRKDGKLPAADSLPVPVP